jgi:gas vesicle protein
MVVMSEEDRGSGFGLTMLFVGLAAGALIALLLTPQTGKQMRKTLRRRYEDARDVVEDFSDQASDWIDKGSDLADKAKSKVAPLAKQFRR